MERLAPFFIRANWYLFKREFGITMHLLTAKYIRF